MQELYKNIKCFLVCSGKKQLDTGAAYYYQGIRRYSLANISYTSIQFCKSLVEFRWSRLFTITQLICAAPSLHVEQSRVAEVQQR